MTKTVFLAKLRKYLKKLPADEVEDIMRYYSEYFDDAGLENEQRTINELGSPRRIASMILASSAINEGKKPSTKSGFSSVMWVILAIFASPVALPLAVAGAAVVIALVVALAAVIVSLGIAAVAIAAGGVAAAVLAIVRGALNSPADVFIVIGAALIAVGLGMACVMLVTWLTKKGFRAIAGLFGRRLKKRAGSDSPAGTDVPLPPLYSKEDNSNENID